MTKTCKCGAEIFFIETLNGAKLPMDAKMQLVVTCADLADDNFMNRIWAYTSHLSTCAARKT